MSVASSKVDPAGSKGSSANVTPSTVPSSSPPLHSASQPPSINISPSAGPQPLIFNPVSHLRPLNEPRHWSVFYPEGVACLPPPSVHYLHLGCWCTVAGGWDYFSHRNLRKGEVIGHRVEWLHTAIPRDKFVFLVEPVEARPSMTWLVKLWTHLYGQPPAFAFARGKLVWSSHGNDSNAQSSFTTKPAKNSTATPAPGTPLADQFGAVIEAIEVLHTDVTAMDYSCGLTSSRLALETRVATTRTFASLEDAYAYYGSDTGAVVSQQPPVQLLETSASPVDPASGLGSRQHSSILASRHRHSSSMDLAGIRHAGSDLEIPSCHLDSSYPAVDSQPPIVEEATEPKSPMPSPEVVPANHDGSGDHLDPLMLPPSTTFTPPHCLPGTARGRSFPHSVPRAASRHALHGAVADMTHPPQPTVQQTAATLRSEADTRAAEHAAASLLHQSTDNKVQPLSTLKHNNTMVTVSTQDPHFNAVLREVLMPEPGTFPFTMSVSEQSRLLSLYEAGMPSWTIFVSRYGLPYRRWFRLTAVTLVNVWPAIALCVGLYDLYKHIPWFREFLQVAFLPLKTWIDNSMVLQLYLMTTYLVTVVYNILRAVYGVLGGLISFIMMCFSPIWWVLSLLVSPTALYPLRFLMSSSSAASGGITLVDFWSTVARPIKNAAKAAYDGVVHVGVSLARREASIRRWYTAKLRKVIIIWELYVDIIVTNWRLFTYLMPTSVTRAIVSLVVVGVVVAVAATIFCVSDVTSLLFPLEYREGRV